MNNYSFAKLENKAKIYKFFDGDAKKTIVQKIVEKKLICSFEITFIYRENSNQYQTIYIQPRKKYMNKFQIFIWSLSENDKKILLTFLDLKLNARTISGDQSNVYDKEIFYVGEAQFRYT